MYRNVSIAFLAGTIAVFLAFAPLSIPPASAATVTDQDIAAQEQATRDYATDAVQSYFRLILYMIIERLETQVDNS